jgi:hypothetical protein
MQQQSLFDNYQRALGKVIGNLHSLEMLLRLFLHNVDSERYGFTPPEVNLDKIKAGDIVGENYLSNYDSLGKLVHRYNKLVDSKNATELRVDEVVIELRDALGHGRILGQQPAPPFRLYRFGRPSGNHKVRVRRVSELTESELVGNIHVLFEELKKVEEACKRFCPNVFGKP